MSARVVHRCVVALGAVLVASAPVGAQGCVETPLLPAGFSVHVRGLSAPSVTSDFAEEPQSRSARGFEVGVARDFHGTTSMAANVASTRSDLTIITYDPNTGETEPQEIDASNLRLDARVAFDVMSVVPFCPFIEAGWFQASLDAESGSGPERDPVGGIWIGSGWTLQPHWTLDRGGDAHGIDLSAFATARIMAILANSIDSYDYERGQEILPKLGLRGGASIAFHRFFAGADAGIVFPAADPD
ncbi:MAG TPA: hypothetical protein VF039_12720, partial [Longimicrobiales bacterium]